MSLTARMLMAGLIAIVTACAGCGGDDDGASGELVTIADVRQFASEFNADRGHPRLVLLLSPT